jgi:hypothetical protein
MRHEQRAALQSLPDLVGGDSGVEKLRPGHDTV